LADSKPSGGIIVATYPGTGPMPPAAITYDVVWVWEDGSAGGANGVHSAQQQGNVDVLPARPGMTFPLVWINDQPYCHIYQPPYFDLCSQNPPPTP